MRAPRRVTSVGSGAEPGRLVVGRVEGERLGIVLALDDAGQPAARRQHEVERGGHQRDEGLHARAHALLVRGHRRHGRAIVRAPSRAPGRGIHSTGMLIRDVMTESVVTAEADSSVREVAGLMRERNVGSVVLVADHVPAGIVTDRDLAVSVLADDRNGGDCAADHASTPVVTAAVAMDVRQAAELMISHGIRRLPVLDGSRLTGIVTLDDLAVRTGDPELMHSLTSQITRAALPEFYFHHRGG